MEAKQEIIRLAAKKGWTNRQLSEVSGVPISTVAAIRSKNNNRFPGMDTAQRLLDVLQDEEENEEDTMARQTDSLSYSDLTKTAVSLYERTIAGKNKWIRILVVMLCTVILFIFAILVYDIMNPHVGWFQT